MPGKVFFERFLEIVSESTLRFDHSILAYCLMTNHIHLIIRVRQASLDVIMQNIAFRYSKWVNHKRGRIGHLFQGRYKSILVKDQCYLVNLCRYIHFNPVEAKIVRKPEEYLWSSHRYYLTKQKPSWLSRALIKRAILKTTGVSYVELINSKPDRETWKPSLFMDENNSLIINDEVMVGIAENWTFKIDAEKLILFDEIISIVNSHFRLNPEALCRTGRSRKLSKIRALSFYYAKRSQATLVKQMRGLVRNQFALFSKEDIRQLEKEIEKALSEKQRGREFK